MLKRFDFSRNDVKHLGVITPIKVLSSSEISLEPLLVYFPNLTNGKEEEIVSQWKLLRFSKLEISVDMDIVEFCDVVSKHTNGLNEKCFDDLINFVFNLMSLPHSSAAAERIFSQLNLVKTKCRNKLDFKTINSIMQSKELCTNRNDSHYVWSAKDIF